MSLDNDEAHAIAIYLFLHKWLAASYSRDLEELLVKDILDAVKREDDES